MSAGASWTEMQTNASPFPGNRLLHVLLFEFSRWALHLERQGSVVLPRYPHYKWHRCVFALTGVCVVADGQNSKILRSAYVRITCCSVSGSFFFYSQCCVMSQRVTQLQEDGRFQKLFVWVQTEMFSCCVSQSSTVGFSLVIISLLLL